MLTQKYKQQQQQVRVLTNESNYLKGMYFTDVPLAEGYSRVLVNFDIDSVSGKLTPRKGLQSLGVVKPDPKSKQYLNRYNGFNTVVASKVCATSDTRDPRKINRYLQAIIYNTNARTLLVATMATELTENAMFKLAPFSLDIADEYIAPEPFVIANPGVYEKACVHNNFFKRPVGAFAFEDGFYTFLKHNTYTARKKAELPNDNYKTTAGKRIEKYTDLLNSQYATGEPGHYFIFISGESQGFIAYYTSKGDLAIWEDSEEALIQQTFKDTAQTGVLCYTKIGAEIKKAGDTLLDTSLIPATIEDDKYYVCTITPQMLNPTEASSWGYNMLLEDPYSFECEKTAINTVTILGVIPYDKYGKIVLTPRKNQEITLKAYYRAPSAFYSDARNLRFYATTKKYIEYAENRTVIKEYEDGTYRDKDGHVVYRGPVSRGGSTFTTYYYQDASGKTYLLSPNGSELETEVITVAGKQDPTTKATLDDYFKNNNINIQNFNFGDWWYCSADKEYYIIAPGEDLTTKILTSFGPTAPPASVPLQPCVSKDTDDKIRIKWEMRSSGASTWTELANEVFTLSEYAKSHGAYTPFTYTGTLPADEVLIRVTVTDVLDNVEEEYVLSTNTIGISLVSDELANTLNLTSSVNYNLSDCTGMCEWEQRLVLWGVPNALNTLFVSDVNNPTFFPYPNNVDLFPDPIIAVHNYGNELLVLTTSALYRLTWDTEGTGWSHTLVQQNLHVTEEDTYMSCVIKNMFFFKSGTYFYMMVPKASSSVRGEVTIAPISKIIANLLDNFHEEVYNLIKVLVDQNTLPDFTNKLVNYFSYVDNACVVVNYVYALDDTTNATVTQSLDSKYLYVQLIYDTEARTWSIRVFEAGHMLYASHADAIQQDRFIDITPSLYDREQLVLQYYKFTNLTDTAVQYIKETGEFEFSNKIVKNYQYIDTGNRDINTELKKRFREFQFKIKNKTNTNLGFFTSFLIDGSLRKDFQHYAPRLIADTVSQETTLIVERVLDTKTMAYNTTRIERILIPERMLQDNGELTPTILAEEQDPDRWILNQSAFPGRTLWKIRMPISGKGFAPRVIMLSTNQADYELLGHAWVYRTMNSR